MRALAARVELDRDLVVLERGQQLAAAAAVVAAAALHEVRRLGARRAEQLLAVLALGLGLVALALLGHVGRDLARALERAQPLLLLFKVALVLVEL